MTDELKASEMIPKGTWDAKKERFKDEHGYYYVYVYSRARDDKPVYWWSWNRMEWERVVLL